VKVSGTILLLVILAAVALVSELAQARGKGSAGAGRSGHHSAARHHHHHHSRVFVGGVVAAPAFWPWWDYPAYRTVGILPAEPLYYIEKSDEGASTGGEWFYCGAANAYFPYVTECPSGWQRVPSQVPPG
jgi:hypothetical protein